MNSVMNFYKIGGMFCYTLVGNDFSATSSGVWNIKPRASPELNPRYDYEPVRTESLMRRLRRLTKDGRVVVSSRVPTGHLESSLPLSGEELQEIKKVLVRGNIPVKDA